jgi:hypothetical protein
MIALMPNKLLHQAWTADIADQLEQLQISLRDTDSIAPVAASLKQYGFALLTGLDKHNTRESTAAHLLSISEELGTVVAQSPRKEMIEDIRDYSDIDEKDERGYRSGGELTPHSDPPTLILLHCLQPAKSGGDSYLVNVRTIHDRMANSDPELLEAMFQGFPHWCVEGQAGGPGPSTKLRPIFMMQDGQVSCAHYRPFVEQAAVALDEPLTPKQVAALDLFDRYANDPDVALRFRLAPGDTMILHNRTVLHARTDYEDWPESDKRRHLLRVWIDAPALLPVSSAHELGDIFA